MSMFRFHSSLFVAITAGALLLAPIPGASAHHHGGDGGSSGPFGTGPVHGPGSTHTPIIYHPVHGPGSSHNPVSASIIRDRHPRPLRSNLIANRCQRDWNAPGCIVRDHRRPQPRPNPGRLSYCQLHWGAPGCDTGVHGRGGPDQGRHHLN